MTNTVFDHNHNRYHKQHIVTQIWSFGGSSDVCCLPFCGYRQWKLDQWTGRLVSNKIRSALLVMGMRLDWRKVKIMFTWKLIRKQEWKLGFCVSNLLVFKYINCDRLLTDCGNCCQKCGWWTGFVICKSVWLN